MKLHQDEELFSDAIRATAAWKGIPDIYIEKDYWVCYALKNIYESKSKDKVVFKGGTSLSKCFGLIERFSEDIDIAVLKNGELTHGQLRRIKKAVTTCIKSPLQATEDAITYKSRSMRKIAYEYPKVFEGVLGQVRDKIIVEVTLLGEAEPYTTASIGTYIYNFLMSQEESELVNEYDLRPFNLLVLTKERTFCEKIMSLIRFSNTGSPIRDLKAKIRHIYDIHKLLEDQRFSTFFYDSGFEKLLLQVAHGDVGSFNDNDWLRQHPKQALLFIETEAIWEELETTYDKEFSTLVYGTLPSRDDIKETIKTIAKRLGTVDWSSITAQIT